MKHLIFLIFFSIMLIDAQSQTLNTYTSEKTEKSTLYQKGNNYQKDFLLFVDLLRSTHPAFAPNQTQPFDLDNVTKKGYDFLKNCSNYFVFNQYLVSVASLLNDGHTYVTPNLDKNGLLYLFQIQIQKDDVNLIMIPNEYGSHLGKIITKINGKPVFEVINSFKNCISSDNEQFFYKQIGNYMQFFSLWETNNYVAKDSVLTLTLLDGNQISIKPEFRPKNMNELAVIQRTGEKINPVTQPQRKPFFYNILEREDICYFQFNQCEDNSTARWQNFMSGKNVPDSILDKKLVNVPRFDTLVAKMFKEIQAKNIKTLVIDVRNNGGGNSILCEILLSYFKPSQQIKQEKSYTRFSPLFEKSYPAFAADARKGLKERNIPFIIGNIYQSQDLDPIEENQEYKILMDKYFHYNQEEKNIFNGNVIFIQGKNTFSSAGLLVTDAIDNGIGQVIGEKSTYKPCNYGDILTWQLPNTQISGGVSHKIFNRPDETKCNETCIVPNILIEETLENILQSEDVYWNWIAKKYSK